jgi:hypothetical protein
MSGKDEPTDPHLNKKKVKWKVQDWQDNKGAMIIKR